MREGLVVRAHFTSNALENNIMVDSELRTVGNASNEEFDEYVYTILGKMYKQKVAMLNRYHTSFDYDWQFKENRIIALNELYAINLAHVSDMRKAAVPLFAEEM